MPTTPATVPPNESEASPSNMVQQTSLAVRQASTSNSSIENMPVEMISSLCDVLPVPDLVCLALTCPLLYKTCKDYYRLMYNQSHFRLGGGSPEDPSFELKAPILYNLYMMEGPAHWPWLLNPEVDAIAERIQDWRGLREYRLLSGVYTPFWHLHVCNTKMITLFLRRSVYGNERTLLTQREDYLIDRFMFYSWYPEISLNPHNMGDEWDVQMRERAWHNDKIARKLRRFPASTDEWRRIWNPVRVPRGRRRLYRSEHDPMTYNRFSN
jgi:hypothetical protein